MNRLKSLWIGYTSKLQAVWRRPRQGLAARLRASVDIIAAASLALLAALLAITVPEGTMFRVIAVLPILLTVPGYLLIQTLAVPMRRPRTRVVHFLLGIGASPVVVGLAAMSTWTVDGGFKAGPVIAMVTIVCLSLAFVAFIRRSINEGPARQSAASPDAADP